MNGSSDDSHIYQVPPTPRPKLVFKPTEMQHSQASSPDLLTKEYDVSTVTLKSSDCNRSSMSFLDKQLPLRTPIPAPRRTLSSSSSIVKCGPNGDFIMESNLFKAVQYSKCATRSNFSRSLDLTETKDVPEECLFETQVCPFSSVQCLPSTLSCKEDLVEDTAATQSVSADSLQPHNMPTHLPAPLIRPVPKPRSKSKLSQDMNPESPFSSNQFFEPNPLSGNQNLREDLSKTALKDCIDDPSHVAFNESTTSECGSVGDNLEWNSFPGVCHFPKLEELVSEQSNKVRFDECSKIEVNNIYIHSDVLRNGHPQLLSSDHQSREDNLSTTITHSEFRSSSYVQMAPRKPMPHSSKLLPPPPLSPNHQADQGTNLRIDLGQNLLEESSSDLLPTAIDSSNSKPQKALHYDHQPVDGSQTYFGTSNPFPNYQPFHDTNQLFHDTNPSLSDKSHSFHDNTQQSQESNIIFPQIEPSRPIFTTTPNFYISHQPKREDKMCPVSSSGVWSPQSGLSPQKLNHKEDPAVFAVDWESAFGNHDFTEPPLAHPLGETDPELAGLDGDSYLLAPKFVQNDIPNRRLLPAALGSSGDHFPCVQEKVAPPLPPRSNHSNTMGVTSPQASPSKKLCSQQSLAGSDIFTNLPTPAFVHNQSNDPFLDSEFGVECHEFNQTQAPQPASPNSLGTHSRGQAHQGAEDLKSTVVVKREAEYTNRNLGLIPGVEVAPDQLSLKNGVPSEVSGQEGHRLDEVSAEVTSHPEDTSQTTRLKVFDSSLLPKKNSRSGYLYKQGGFKANKGWKKRWVVYNGASLSYYNDDTTAISKRIIPVRCMVDVETDVKASDKTSFRFKLVTTLKDRIFVFSSETLDDCLTWANMLMAAVTEYSKSLTIAELSPMKPGIEGFIKFGNMKKYYVTITGKMLSYFQSFEDYEMGSPVHEIDMKLASVKVKDHKKLQLWIHYGHFNLIFESDQEMQHWRLAMEDAIAEGLADDTVLKKVYQNLSNQHCADCRVENPHWASINMGIVVCKNCAGVHRMFDYRVSKIRSLRMDTRVWTPSLVELMVTIGNANANAFWEPELHAEDQLEPTDSMEQRKEFIFKKYHSKKFCQLHPLANQGSSLGEALLAAARTDNVLEMIRILFSGADVLYRQEEGSPSAYEIAKEHGQRLIMELLYQNGGDPQSLEQDVTDEKRLREDVRLQGYLNKAGPAGRNFEKRWCVLEHGAFTYYMSEKSKTFKGSIHRKHMNMIQAVQNERNNFMFELSTSLKDAKIFTFSTETRDDSGEWIRTVAKLMAPVCVMEPVGMIDVKLAGYAFIKESLTDDWYSTFVVFSMRGIYFVNKDLKLDYVDLRKASGIKMQEAANGYQQSGPCFIISSLGKSLYLQASLSRDTHKMYSAFLEAVVSSGTSLNDQALTNENVPVIVEKCITHVYMHGLEERGIYRVAGQNSRVQSLLEEFRKDVSSVALNSYTVQDVSNVLKRFLRELDDSVFGRMSYNSWINMAGCRDVNKRLMWYKYYLEKMPKVNYQTLRRIILHLIQISQHESANLMSITNLASCFAPSLMRTASDEQSFLDSDTTSKEINIMIDLMNNSEYFFNVNEDEKIILNNIRQAEKEIQKRIQENRKSVVDAAAAGILIPVQLLSREGQSINILVNEDKTAKEAMDYLRRNKVAPQLAIYVLHEQLFNGILERPLFPEDIIARTTNCWMEWESWVLGEGASLCVQGLQLLEKLNTYFSPNHALLSKHQYCDSKPKSRFKRRLVGFRQCILTVYSDSQGNVELSAWKVEDITIYLGSVHRKPLPPYRHCLTFTVSGEKYTRPPFGHCLSFETEHELYRWASILYAAQHPSGLLSWANDCD